MYKILSEKAWYLTSMYSRYCSVYSKNSKKHIIVSYQYYCCGIFIVYYTQITYHVRMPKRRHKANLINGINLFQLIHWSYISFLQRVCFTIFNSLNSVNTSITALAKKFSDLKWQVQLHNWKCFLIPYSLLNLNWIVTTYKKLVVLFIE